MTRLIGAIASILLMGAVITAHAKADPLLADQVFELQGYADTAYQSFGLSKPWPELRLVNRRDDMLKSSDVIAQAAVFSDFTRVLYFNRSALGRATHIVTETIDHEAAHFAAWEAHGYDIRTHGRQFEETCLSEMSALTCKRFR